MKLEKDFLGKSGVFDISKVPDIYDCVKYDLQHNREVLVSGHAEELYMYAKNMADVSKNFLVTPSNSCTVVVYPPFIS